MTFVSFTDKVSTDHTLRKCCYQLLSTKLGKMQRNSVFDSY